jgi:dipeptidyl aminopeptidase/acylaminoacyl peptidase
MKKLLFIALLLEIGICSAQNSIEQFLSYPTESNFASSRDAKNLAWVINDHGKRNIIVKLATSPPRMLTAYDQDDGQEIYQLVFSPDATKLVFVRGGAPNNNGQNPNPSSLTEGVDQAIYVSDVTAAATPIKITQGYSPVFYKEDNKIIFSKGGQLFTSGLEPNASPKPLFSARGTNSSVKFSPDGSEVVFTSDRDDHSFIGIYSLIKKTIRWVAPDVAHDALPVWSPDGKNIVYVRTAGTKISEKINYLGGNPFSIWVANATTCAARQVWKSPGNDGGFAQGYPVPPLAWTAANRILFFSEHTGWNHVFSMNPDGGDLKDITPGDGEVESFALDVAGQHIYFDGNREDIDRRHIWKSDVIAGKPAAVTAGTEIEMYPVAVGNDIYCFRSSFNASKSLAKIDEAKKTTTLVYPQKLATFAPTSFVVPEQAIFKAADGTIIHGQLFINRTVKGKRAGIVFMHGGPTRQMLLGFHYSDYYINSYAFNQFLANQGYAVVAVNYRAGMGYGRDFRLAKNTGPRGASEYQDVVAAGKYLQSLPDVEATKIGLWGGSYGGFLTAMGLSRNPEIFKAGVDLHGVHDWSFLAADATRSWALDKDDLDLARKSSPVSDLSHWTAPVLFIHGDDDRNVVFQQTTDLAERLREKNVPVEVLILPDEVHGFLRYESWEKAYTAAKDFFDRRLK